MIRWREPVPETPREFSGLRMTRLTNRMKEPRPPAWLGWLGWFIIGLFGGGALWTMLP
jgi:hypothetical protein